MMASNAMVPCISKSLLNTLPTANQLTTQLNDTILPTTNNPPSNMTTESNNNEEEDTQNDVALSPLNNVAETIQTNEEEIIINEKHQQENLLNKKRVLYATNITAKSQKGSS